MLSHMKKSGRNLAPCGGELVVGGGAVRRKLGEGGARGEERRLRMETAVKRKVHQALV